MIFPSSRVAYILDSMKKPMQNPVDTCYVLKLLDMAFARYEKKHINSNCNMDSQIEGKGVDYDCCYAD
ncbi:unnamed protein product [Lactuca virosa]|uniref:Uncharacterized protein n=1 Tax=Lactuca virosa TaxID=75947 RepID=A0AAU9PTF8_9ASTR|nr:unnamed protein product [Lactuca virosa]